MRTDTPQPVRLSDYRPYPFLIETTELEFQLEPSATRVKATLEIKRSGAPGEPLFLNGERLTLISAAIDGQTLSPNEYSLDGEGLTIHQVPDAFVLTTEVEIDPS